MPGSKQQFSIVIPCKNEGEGLSRIIKSVRKYSNDIIVIDGHSTDNTKQIAKQEKARFYLDAGKGRGGAVRLGLKKAKHPYVLFFDADGSHDPKDILSFITPLAQDKADLVLGSRRSGGSLDIEITIPGLIRTLGADILTLIINLAFKSQLSDVLYSYRAIKKEVGLELNLDSDGFTIEQEMVAKALHKNFRVIEIPSREFARGWGESKLSTITGISFLFHLINLVIRSKLSL